MISNVSTSHPYLDTFYKVGKEVLKTAATMAALCAASVAYFSDKIRYRSIFIVVGYSIIDEVIARSIIQGTIHAFQNFWNSRVKVVNEIERARYQKIFRIAIASCIYATTQLLIVDNTIHRIIRFAYTAFSGLAYGHFKENSESIFPPILFHAVRNICIISMTSGSFAALLGIFVYDLLCYYYATSYSAKP